MRALITGIEGFVGGYLKDFLINENIEIIGTFRPEKDYKDPKIEVQAVNILNYHDVNNTIKRYKPAYIFHLAGQSSVAESWKNPAETMRININGAINILESTKNNHLDTKILLVGSGEEYGPVEESDLPINETVRPNPQNPYALSKLTQGLIGLQYYKAFGVKSYIARSFNHSGPGQPPGFVIPDFAKQIACIELKVNNPVLKVGNLSAKRDFTDVRDIVKGYWNILTKGNPGEYYNVGSGKAISIQYILDTLISFSKVDINVLIDNEKFRPIDTPIIVCDNFKLKNSTGWDTEHPIEKTIEDTLEYWRLEVAKKLC